jgi:hypothetical protein
VRNEDKLTTLLINAKATVTAKADEALGKTLKEFRVETEKQLNKKIKAESPLASHFATTFAIFILTFNIFIFIFNSFVSDPADHHFQTFTLESSAIAKCFVYHNRQLQSRRRPQ